jgi:predicted porin
VQYWTPDFNGFTVKLHYSTAEDKTDAHDSQEAYSVSGIYDKGPLYVGVGYEQHKHFLGATVLVLVPMGDDRGIRLGAAYTFFGTTTLGGVYEELKYEGSGVTTKIKDYAISLVHNMGPHVFQLGYAADRGVEQSGSEVPDTRARQWSVGYAYKLSKRTALYAQYTKIDNEAASTNDFGNNGIGILGATLATSTPGADPSGFALGMRHVF